MLEAWRKLWHDPDYAAARLRTVIALLSAILTALSATNQLAALSPKWAPVIAAIGTALAASISQGEKNKEPKP